MLCRAVCKLFINDRIPACQPSLSLSLSLCVCVCVYVCTVTSLYFKLLAGRENVDKFPFIEISVYISMQEEK